jgi:hypothetical protein
MSESVACFVYCPCAIWLQWKVEHRRVRAVHPVILSVQLEVQVENDTAKNGIPYEVYDEIRFRNSESKS